MQEFQSEQKMIELATLKYLVTKTRKDANILLKHDRKSGAIYLMGYALELQFKRKVSLNLQFLRGFPESKLELDSYLRVLSVSNSISTGIMPTAINQIRTHDLKSLIIYSGAEVRIRTNFLLDWLTVKNWTPEDRYIKRRCRQAETIAFFQAANRIIKQIR